MIFFEDHQTFHIHIIHITMMPQLMHLANSRFLETHRSNRLVPTARHGSWGSCECCGSSRTEVAECLGYEIQLCWMGLESESEKGWSIWSMGWVDARWFMVHEDSGWWMVSKLAMETVYTPWFYRYSLVHGMNDVGVFLFEDQGTIPLRMLITCLFHWKWHQEP